MKRILILSLLIIAFSCGRSEKQEEKPDIKEADLVLNSDYKIGDVRRYGVFPDSVYAFIHPKTNKSKIESILDASEQEGFEIYFPKGYYKSSLILDGRQNVSIKSDGAEFDLIHITEDTTPDKKPKNLKLKGVYFVYDRLGITEATNIEIDTVYIKTNLEKNLRKLRSRGCHIYHGTKYLSIKHLEIDDLGSGGAAYNNSHASLAIDGWKNNPENVNIHSLYIKSSDRHGIYLTGKNHMINEVVIDRFGTGDSNQMLPMQDALASESKLFAGIWINRCYNSTIGRMTINTGNSGGSFTTNFDEGNPQQPVIINILEVNSFTNKLPIHFAENTGVIVRETMKK